MLARCSRQEMLYDLVHPWGNPVRSSTTLQLGMPRKSSVKFHRAIAEKALTHSLLFSDLKPAFTAVLPLSPGFTSVKLEKEENH